MNGRGSDALLRAVLGIALPLLLLVAAMLPLWLFQERLPEPIATHWRLDGRPNGAMSMHGLILFLLAFVGIPAAGITFLAHRAPAGRGEISAPMAIATFMAGLIAAVNWMIVLNNLDAAVWTQADRLNAVALAVPLIAAGVLAATVARYGRRLEAAPPAPVNAPRVGLAPGARAVWMGTARAAWAAPMVVAGVALGVVAAAWKPSAGLPFGAIGLVGLAFTSIRVTIDRNGVRIAYGAFGWPVQRVRLADIEQASVLDVNPMAWGGWGYRGSLRMMGRAAVVLRGGEGVRLDLAGGRTMVITVDGAAQGAGLINDLLAASRAA